MLNQIIFIFAFIAFINADDGGLSDIPFNGTPDDVEDAFRTKMAVELAEKGKIPVPSKKNLPAVIAAGSIKVGGSGSSRPAEMNIAGAGSFGDGTSLSLEKTGKLNAYSSSSLFRR